MLTSGAIGEVHEGRESQDPRGGKGQILGVHLGCAVVPAALLLIDRRRTLKSEILLTQRFTVLAEWEQHNGLQAVLLLLPRRI